MTLPALPPIPNYDELIAGAQAQPAFMEYLNAMRRWQEATAAEIEALKSAIDALQSSEAV